MSIQDHEDPVFDSSGHPVYNRVAVPDDIPGGPNDFNVDSIVAHVDELKISLDFIKALQNATLESSVDRATVSRMRQPAEEPLDLNSDPDLRWGVRTYLSTNTASEATYTSARNNLIEYAPAADPPSFEQMKLKMAELSGVTPIFTDMCPDSCHAYTGPFAELIACYYCHKPRYTRNSSGELVPAQQALTVPIGPQIQALHRSPESAQALRWRWAHTTAGISQAARNHGNLDIIDDFCLGTEHIAAVTRGDIKEYDTVLTLSIDGAQLYQDKKSDCWFGIWVILDYDPQVRYKKRKVVPAFIIPGPNPPRHMDSYFFPSVHHLIAVQREGLLVWDALDRRTILKNLFLALVEADTPAMAYLTGFVGHHGAYACRLICPVKGRHQEGAPTYYMAHLKPHDYDHVPASAHPDYDIDSLPQASSARYYHNLRYLLAARNDTAYALRRRESGLAKPSIFIAIPRNRMSGIPGLCSLDIMHLFALNITALLLDLWRGLMRCEGKDDKRLWAWLVLVGDVWIEHGASVAACRSYLPGSWDRPPRDPSKKISSGYKAWEYLTWFYGLGPALLSIILPELYWKNYCKLVRGVRLVQQSKGRSAQLVVADTILLDFMKEFEMTYYQQNPDRLHFCRVCIHLCSHLVPETVRIGPQDQNSQWTMERTIGNLGEEVRQPSQPFANLAQRALRRAQENAVYAMHPWLSDAENTLPRGARDLGDHFILLRAKDRSRQIISGAAARAIKSFFPLPSTDSTNGGEIRLQRWARIRLPNGQIARSLWKERLRPIERIRIARNVKVGSTYDSIIFSALNLMSRIFRSLLIQLHRPKDLAKSSSTSWLRTQPTH